ncbi:MAG: HmuY family protein [Prevotella sp.]|nr:HmuY family protein [Prevotella sp.]
MRVCLERIGIVFIAIGTFLFCSCDGIYDDISNMPADNITDNSFSYIDATDYTTWVYIDLADGTLTTLAYDDSINIPDSWTFALHRYDCKTNGGKVLETAFTSIDEFLSAVESGLFTLPDETEFTADSEEEIIIDVSHMVEGTLIYAPAQVNVVMTRWLDVNLITMPPIYTQSGKVYLIRFADFTCAAVRFTGFTNPYYYDAKGYISFEYIYPVEWQ